ncbi:FG-GAP-like repeat-containing protein [Myroides odoratus]|uniref:FG-GAP-like repeat-containing protein n=1 Tax=Myroides odoratus TaxID=256 RepID=UPI0039AED545
MYINTVKRALCLLSLCILGSFNTYAQHFREHTGQTFQGVFYGDCSTLNSNNDAYPDLIFSGTTAGYGSGNTAVYLNNQDHFTPLSDSFSKIMYSAIGTGDLDGNGFMDFAITGFRKEAGFTEEKVFEIYYNNGDNTFTKKNIGNIAPTQFGSIKIADLNGDGRLDLLVNGQSDGGYSTKVYFQQEDEEFVEANLSLIGTYFSATEIFDANGDGLPDILITGFNTSYTPDTKLYLNLGNGNFQEHNAGLDGVYFSSISVADFEGDGDLDVLLSGMRKDANGEMKHSLILYLNDGQGNFTPSPHAFEGIIMGSAALVDYNNDGFLDVFAFGSTASSGITTNLYKNQNNVSFVRDEENSALIRGLSTSRAKWFDFDQDGDMDLFVMGYTSDGEAMTMLYENTVDPVVEENYCEVGVDFDVQPITLVKMAGIENRTDARVNGTPAYENFTAIEGSVQQGQTYTLQVKGNTDGQFSNDIRVFIDWNQDFQFDMTTEYYTASLAPSTGEDAVEVTLNIRIPDDAVLGKTRMRIIKDMWNVYEEGEFDACLNAYYGQIEDYSLRITAGESEPTCNNNLPGLNPGDTGCVTFTYNGAEVTYATVRAADGTIWLQQNLGSEQVATSATDTSGFGDLFQWGRWADGHQKRTSTVSSEVVTPNNPLGLGATNTKFYATSPSWWAAGNATDTWEARTPQDVSAIDGCDPCKALGEGWSLPTQDQWQASIDAEHITNIQTAFDSNLRLTVAGARGSSGVYNDGVRGYYWSKTTSSNRDFAKHLYYSNFIVNTGAGAPREQGSAIRCIRIAPIVTPEEYCEPEISEAAYSLPIYSFTFGETTQTSGNQTNVDPIYEDFTAITISAVKGQTYGVTVKGKTDGQDNLLVKVYIDYNRDFEFSEDESSTIGFLTNVGNESGEVSGTIQIPAIALTGTTRMRVVNMYHNPESTWMPLENVPCPTGYYLGQVEDYTISIQEGNVTVTAVEVYTENNRPAEITAENGTLQLVARVLPTEANQAVVWSIVEGTTNASINQNGLVTALANGVVKVKATSVHDPSKAAEIQITIDIEALRCPPIQVIKVQEIGEQTATITIESQATVFDVEYGIAGFERGQGTTVSNVSNVHQIEGLIAEVAYDVYVRVATCSTWQKVNFTTIKLKEQRITVADVTKQYGDIPFTTGESTSNLPLAYTIADPAIAVVEEGVIVIKGAGETEVVVNQEGNIEYLPAEQVRFTLRVNPAPLTLFVSDKTKVYDGRSEENWLISYDGFVYGENETILSGNLQKEGTAVGARDVGTYTMTIHGYTALNYAIAYREGTLTIAKATLPTIEFEEQTFVYDGSPKSIVITQELPQGVVVTYVGNEQTEVGNYLVKAIVNGGINYKNIEIEARMLIRKQLPNLIFDAATYTYDSTSKRIDIQNIPEGITVTYTNNEQTEVGSYTVTASIDGGNSYESVVLTALLKIEKATLNQLVRLVNQSFVYDSQVKSLHIQGEIPAGVQITYTGNDQIEVGNYEVKAHLVGGNNYEDAELSALLSITKGRLTELAFENQTLSYNGTAQSIAITGTLPQGVQVVYTNNSQTEIGVYQVIATLDGGRNYENLVLTATMKIEVGVISGITLASTTFVYDGTVKSLLVSGGLPEGFTVTYTNNAHTNAGTYPVTATISGGAHYEDLVVSATLVITKATLTGIRFDNQTFVYDGTSKSIFISGSLPNGVTVVHANNGKTNVGIYEVEAKVQGGTNYLDQRLTATMTIEKATAQIIFDEIAPLLLDESVDFQLQATSTSGLPLTYSYTYVGANPAAEVSRTGWVTLKKVGEITIKVSQEGNQNYHQEAAVSRVLRIVNNDATIHEISIENESYTTPQKEIYHLVSCGDLNTAVSVTISVAEGAKVTPSNTFVIQVPKPGIYKQKVTVTSQNGKVTEDYVITVEKAFAFKEIAEVKFNNTLLINKNPKTNGGYNFVAFQWFKNGNLVSEQQVYSVGNTTLLDKKDVYHAIVTTAEGEEIHVCPMERIENVIRDIQLYPNPVILGQKTTLLVKVAGINLKGIPVQIYNLNGQLLHTISMEGESTAIYLPQTMPSGMYLAVFELNGQRESIKFAVKK